ncbi:hypothetical protein [Hymenobacter siberiensis]|uniref:hypothetical protein n=1 Tax=Hymenobacter siberiensis TaxID=2848396 RepID=UPI001D02FB1A|nr:hypothetical protein [Hymenobacter siberiensis]
MAAQSIAQVVQSLGKPTPTPTGSIKPRLNQEMQLVADAIKVFMLAELEAHARHKLSTTGSGIASTATAAADVTGVSIGLPAYADSIDQGRKPGGKLVPLESIIGWLLRYKIASNKKVQKGSGINSAAYAIQRSIYLHGIKAKPFLEATIQFRDELVDKVVDTVILPQIAATLDLIFLQK